MFTVGFQLFRHASLDVQLAKIRYPLGIMLFHVRPMILNDELMYVRFFYWKPAIIAYIIYE